MSGGLVTQLDEHSERSLLWLMFARLVLSLLSFGIAINLAPLGGALAPEASEGLYWSLTLAFLATVFTGVVLPRVRRPRRFALLQIGVDVAICTALVYFTGGRDSVFTFLYVVVTLYGAVLFERPGGLAGAVLSGIGFGAVLVAVNLGWIADFAVSPRALTPGMLLGIWSLHVGALLLVGALASALTRELRRAGAALSRSTHELLLLRDLHQRTVESLMSGLLTTDPEARVTSANPEAARLTGWDAPAMFGRAIDEIVPGAGSVLTSADEDSDPSPSRARLPFRSVDGRQMHLGLAGSVLRETDGTSIGHVLIFQDVTKVVAMEGELRTTERMAAVGEMAAKMAHEIRNPLAAISGSIQILRADLSIDPNNPEPARLMEIVVRETDRLNGLLRDFLQYARPSPPSPEPLELGALVADVMRIFDSTRSPDVKVICEQREAAEVVGDSSQLRQVLWNLCLNAVQAMPDGGSLRIETGLVGMSAPQGGRGSRRNGANVGADDASGTPRWGEIVVTDTGPGIPVELQEQIFEPFFTSKKEGSGLGLATVHRVVESHGGNLQLHSELGRGTTFRIQLPCHGDEP